MQNNKIMTIFTPIYLLAWITLTLYIASFHEPFADEAQSFLISRDASMIELLTSIARAEGTHILWYLWLKLLLALGISYKNIYLASIIPMFAGVVIFVYKAPFSSYIRFLFPLTYYIFFQYNIISRSYSLLFLAINIVALSYEKRNKHPLTYTISLILLGSISAYSFVLACGLFALYIFEQYKNQSFHMQSFCLYTFFVLCTLLILWPNINNQYIQSYTHKPFLFASNAFFTMSMGFINSYFLSSENLLQVDLGLIYFALLMYVLFQLNRLMLLLLMLPNLLLMIIIPYHPWHSGILIMTALLMFWLNPRPENTRLMRILLVLFFVMQIFWSGFALCKEKNETYSGSKDLYTFIQKQKIPPQEVYTLVFNGVGINPYINNPQYSWWDWTQKRYMIDMDIKKILQHDAFIINEEAYSLFSKEFNNIAQNGNYKHEVFFGSQFFAFQDMSIHETLHLFYREK